MKKKFRFKTPVIAFFTLSILLFGCKSINDMSRAELSEKVVSTVHKSAACKLCEVSNPSENVLAEIKSRGIVCSDLSVDDCVWRNSKGEKEGEYSLGSSCSDGCECKSGYCSPEFCSSDGYNMKVCSSEPVYCIPQGDNFEALDNPSICYSSQ